MTEPLQALVIAGVLQLESAQVPEWFTAIAVAGILGFLAVYAVRTGGKFLLALGGIFLVLYWVKRVPLPENLSSTFIQLGKDILGHIVDVVWAQGWLSLGAFGVGAYMAWKQLHAQVPVYSGSR